VLLEIGRAIEPPLTVVRQLGNSKRLPDAPGQEPSPFQPGQKQQQSSTTLLAR
jgi:hypothetical protein